MKRFTLARLFPFSLLAMACALLCLQQTALAYPHISTDKRTYRPGEAIQVYYSGAPGANGDWICIVSAATPDNDAGPNWQHMPYGLQQGMLTFVAPSPGEYQARAYFGYRSIGYVVAARSSFRVAPYAEPPPRTYWQRTKEIPVTGQPDPKLKEVQYALMERGYDPGVADGVSGRQTRAALRAFQKDNRLKQTGELNRETLLALGVIGGGSRQEKEGKIDQRRSDPAGEQAPTPPQSGQGAGLLDPKDTTPPQDSPASSPPAGAAPPVQAIPGAGKITAATTLVAEASVMADKLDDVPKGASVDIIGAQDNFLKVRYNGKEGYIHSTFVQRQ